MLTNGKVCQLGFADGRLALQQQHIALDIGAEIFPVHRNGEDLGFGVRLNTEARIRALIPYNRRIFRDDRLWLERLDGVVFAVRHEAVDVLCIRLTAEGFLGVEIDLSGDDLTVRVAVAVGQHMCFSVVVNDNRNVVEVLTGAVPREEHYAAGLIGKIIRVDVDVVVGIPVIGIKLVMRLRGIPDVSLVEVIGEDPRIGVKFHTRLGTVGVIILFQLCLVVVARLIQTPAHENRAPVAVEVLTAFTAVHQIPLRPAGIFGVARFVFVHAQLRACPEQTVRSRLLNVDARGRVVLIALL